MSGNVAFKLGGVTLSCTSQQFILNFSGDGTKNMYALLLSAKTTGIVTKAHRHTGRARIARERARRLAGFRCHSHWSGSGKWKQQ